ncbi:hypothetical protein [Limnohabitans sp.]|uniref:hypothetical protein n=1 Tax=Limnohabitans sp. TaxID=1907725 RepID=UPI00334207D7
MADATPNITKIPAPRVPLLDQRTGLISREWFRFFNNLYVVTGGETQGVVQIINGGTGASTVRQAQINLELGSVTRVGGTGTVNGITLTGEVTTSGDLVLGGLLSNVSLSAQTIGTLDMATRATGVLPIANGGTGVAATTVVTKTADFTLDDTEKWVINNKSGSTCVVTLPAASSWGGRSVVFKNLQAQTLVSASSNVAPIGSATPGTAILPATVGAWATLVSDGTNWVVMQS